MTNQQTAVATVARKSALAVMASRFNVEPAKLLTTLKNTVFKGATDDECMALVIVANEYNLNPFRKEIYGFPAKGGGITPVVSVDGWSRIMNERSNFDGIEFEMVFDDKQKPVSCTSVIYLKDRSKPVKVTEYYEECLRGTDNWRQMPRRMLRHRALCQGVRVAFSVGGILDEDEAQAMNDPVSAAKPVFAPLTKPAELPEPAATETTNAITEAEKAEILAREAAEAAAERNV